MNMLRNAYEPMVMLERSYVSDGLGGFNSTEWKEGAEFLAYVNFVDSAEARSADKKSTFSSYTVTMPKNVTLEYHDVFKRRSDGAVFRATSNSDDYVTPEWSTFQFKKATAERWNPV